MLSKVIEGQRLDVAGTMDFVLVECCNCVTPFFMLTRLNKKLRESKETFYCPFGHPQSYSGKNEAERLREQIENLKKETEKREQELQNKWLDALGEKHKLEKQLKRVHRGVCPCCNRSFIDLQRHMKTKHPELLENKKSGVDK